LTVKRKRKREMMKKIRKEKREEGKKIYNGLNLPQFKVGVGQFCFYVKG
jgi:hypothetical protein